MNNLKDYSNLTLKDAENEFFSIFQQLSRRFNCSEIFKDMLDHFLLCIKWWDRRRDFSFWKDKYGNDDKFLPLFCLWGVLTDNQGVGFKDILGDIFMNEVSHGQNGQFFTPEPICDFMAKITGVEQLKSGQSVLDPACGSGRMLLSAAKQNREAYFFGADVDEICVKMTTLNLLVNNLVGEVAHMNSITSEFYGAYQINYKIFGGSIIPIYKVIDKNQKEQSLIWINQFVGRNYQNQENETEKMPAWDRAGKKLKLSKQIIEKQLSFDF